jgi:hypothetical protein
MSETSPPDNGRMQPDPVPHESGFRVGDPAVPAPARKPKPPTNGVFFMLGMFTPFVVVAALTALTSTFSVVGVLLSGLSVLMLVGFLIVLIVGRGNGNVRLASYGKGGLWAYAVAALLGLLAFGTCIVGLGSPGN